MSIKQFAFIAISASVIWLTQSVAQRASAQVTVQFGTPTYYGNTPVYQGGNYSGNSQPYRSYNGVPTQRYSSGYRGYVSPTYNYAPYNGNAYQSFRPNYYSQPQRVYGNGYGYGYGNGYGNGQPIYGNGYNYGYTTPSQSRGAVVGGTIGNAIGGTRGGNIGAAIGAAVESR